MMRTKRAASMILAVLSISLLMVVVQVAFAGWSWRAGWSGNVVRACQNGAIVSFSSKSGQSFEEREKFKVYTAASLYSAPETYLTLSEGYPRQGPGLEALPEGLQPGNLMEPVTVYMWDEEAPIGTSVYIGDPDDQNPIELLIGECNIDDQEPVPSIFLYGDLEPTNSNAPYCGYGSQVERINFPAYVHVQDVDVYVHITGMASPATLTLGHRGIPLKLIDGDTEADLGSGCDDLKGNKHYTDYGVPQRPDYAFDDEPGDSYFHFPAEPLSTFDNLSANGNWSLQASSGTIHCWCLRITGYERRLASLYVRPGPNGRVDVDPLKEFYAIGDEVTLTAQPDPGYEFQSWGRALSGSDNPATLIIDNDRVVTATFVPEQPDFLRAFMPVALGG